MSGVPVHLGDYDSDAYECEAPTEFDGVPGIIDVSGSPVLTVIHPVTVNPATAGVSGATGMSGATGVSGATGLSGVTKKSRAPIPIIIKLVDYYKKSESHLIQSSRCKPDLIQDQDLGNLDRDHHLGLVVQGQDPKIRSLKDQ